MTAMQILRERLIKDKEIFPDKSEYINGIISDIDNELLAEEKKQMDEYANFAYESAYSNIKPSQY